MPKSVKPEELVAFLDRSPLLLLTDYDGTLVPIAATPGQAAPSPDLIELLDGLSGLKDVQVAVISGRPLNQLEEWLPGDFFYLAGTHGVEIKEPGKGKVELVDRAVVQKEITLLAGRAQELTRGKEGFLVENKGIAIALHYRLAEWQQVPAVLLKFRYAAEETLSGPVTFLEGKKVLEVLPGKWNKGVVVHWLVSRFSESNVIYLGDDITDEYAFQAVQGFGAGMGVLISEKDRPSCAFCRLESPVEVSRLLHLIIKKFTRETG